MENQMPDIKVIISDDHSLVRDGISAIIKNSPNCTDIKIIGEAENGLDAIEKVKTLHPDIVLMDINMPKLGGYEATIELKKTDPSVKVIVLTQYEDKEYIIRFLKVGASGYIPKKAIGEELIAAIRAVHRGETYLHPSIAGQVVDGLFKKKDWTNEQDPYDKLTDREKQILKLIAEGYTHKEIANMLNISVKTAIAHQYNISEKLDLHTKFDLIKFAIKKGIVKIED
jgi:DNA-binding NarL/FixJ family response regulator